MRVVQSNQEFLLNGELDIQVSVTKRMEGRSRNKSNAPPRDTAEKRDSKLTIVKIMVNSYDIKTFLLDLINDFLDNSCGYRAIYVGLRYHELEVKSKGTRHPDVYTEWRKATATSYSMKHQTEGMERFCREYGLNSSYCNKCGYNRRNSRIFNTERYPNHCN
jgi:hypothetical protein